MHTIWYTKHNIHFLVGQLHGKLLFYSKAMVIISDECCSEHLSHVCSAPSFWMKHPTYPLSSSYSFMPLNQFGSFSTRSEASGALNENTQNQLPTIGPKSCLRPSYYHWLCLSTFGFSLMLSFDLCCLQTKKYNGQMSSPCQVPCCVLGTPL